MASWSKKIQTDPPDFGRAKFIPRFLLNFIVKKRSARNVNLISQSKTDDNIRSGLVSIVILSCKRLEELKRLVKSLRNFLENEETFINYEIVLVDNGSGEELISWARGSSFFDRIIANKKNLGMALALNEAYKKVAGEYILLIEDDFIIDYSKPFIQDCINLFDEFPDIGIIRLKNQRNWGKRYRIIGPIRTTSSGLDFWTWVPSLNGKLNVWCAGSVIFRKISFSSTGDIPVGPNYPRSASKHHGVLYEEDFGKKYNKFWLAAKIKNCYPFIQPNDNNESPGWEDGP